MKTVTCKFEVCNVEYVVNELTLILQFCEICCGVYEFGVLCVLVRCRVVGKLMSMKYELEVVNN